MTYVWHEYARIEIPVNRGDPEFTTFKTSGFYFDDIEQIFGKSYKMNEQNDNNYFMATTDIVKTHGIEYPRTIILVIHDMSLFTVLNLKSDDPYTYRGNKMEIKIYNPETKTYEERNI